MLAGVKGRAAGVDDRLEPLGGVLVEGEDVVHDAHTPVYWQNKRRLRGGGGSVCEHHLHGNGELNCLRERGRSIDRGDQTASISSLSINPSRAVAAVECTIIIPPMYHFFLSSPHT